MKQEFIPDIVDPFMKTALLPVTEIHNLIIPLFFDMIHCEYFLCMSQPSQRLIGFDEYSVPHQLITTLDAQVTSGNGEVLFRNAFERLLFQICLFYLFIAKLNLFCVKDSQRNSRRTKTWTQMSILWENVLSCLICWPNIEICELSLRMNWRLFI